MQIESARVECRHESASLYEPRRFAHRFAIIPHTSSATLNAVTPGPGSSITPAMSIPNTSGAGCFACAALPDWIFASRGLSPLAVIRTSTCPADGLGLETFTIDALLPFMVRIGLRPKCDL